MKIAMLSDMGPAIRCAEEPAQGYGAGEIKKPLTFPFPSWYYGFAAPGTAPIKKNGGLHSSAPICARGETPIIKNIVVVDEQGREYEATYPKRAYGLVKKGRARFIDENKICLACPPNILEDTEMEYIQENTAQEQTTERDACTMEYILSRMDKILNDTSHIHEAIGAIQNMRPNEGLNNVDGDKARGNAVAQTVAAREETNRQMLRFLERMYGDLTNRGPETDQALLRDIITASNELEPEQMHAILSEVLQKL